MYIRNNQQQLKAESYQDKQKNKERASRTIVNRWGDVSEIVGATIFLASKIRIIKTWMIKFDN
jgi:hypothetical protein